MWIVQGKKKCSFPPFYRFCSFPSGELHDPHEIPKMNTSNHFDLQWGWWSGLGFPHWWHFRDGNYWEEMSPLGRWPKKWGSCTRERGVGQVLASPSQPLKVWPESPTSPQPSGQASTPALPASPVFCLPDIRKGVHPEVPLLPCLPPGIPLHRLIEA